MTKRRKSPVQIETTEVHLCSRTARAVAAEVGLEDVRAGLLPEDKRDDQLAQPVSAGAGCVLVRSLGSVKLSGSKPGRGER